MINGKKIKARRVELGLNLRQAAEAAGWRLAQSWKRIEDHPGDLRYSTLVATCKALKCEIGDIVD